MIKDIKCLSNCFLTKITIYTYIYATADLPKLHQSDGRKRPISTQTDVDLYWQSYTHKQKLKQKQSNVDFNKNQAANEDNNRIQVVVNNTSDMFSLKSLKTVWYFDTLFSKRWNNNNNNNSNSNSGIDNHIHNKNIVRIDGIKNWNVMHLKYLIKMRKNRNDIPDKLPFDTSFLLSLIECDIYLSGDKPIITQNFLLNHLYQCENEFYSKEEYKTFYKLFCNNGIYKTNASKPKSKSGIVEYLPLSISKLKDVLIQFDNDKEKIFCKELEKVFDKIATRRHDKFDAYASDMVICGVSFCLAFFVDLLLSWVVKNTLCLGLSMWSWMIS